MIRPDVLISAFFLQPGNGVGTGRRLSLHSGMAEECNLTVITEELQNRTAIETRRKGDPIFGRVRFHYIPWPSVTRQGERNSNVNFVRYFRLYREWQRKAVTLRARWPARTIFTSCTILRWSATVSRAISGRSRTSRLYGGLWVGL